MFRFFNQNSKGNIALYLILAFVIMGAFAMSGASYTGIKSSQFNKETSLSFVEEKSTDKKSLQLRTLKAVTPTPTSTPTPTTIPPTPAPTTPIVPTPTVEGGCTPYTSMADGCVCGPQHQQWLYCNGKMPPDNYDCFDQNNPICIEMAKNNPRCEWWCMGKPVIYLYPKVKTLVDVKLTIPGSIYISIPEYPKNGWQDVIAMPDGKLFYKGKQYPNLYYESEVKDVKAPKDGIFIKTSNLKKELTRITTSLGLIKAEQDEFLEYWLPLLYELKKPSILFSLIEPHEKQRIDHVDINPKPDTFIEFLAYFKGVDKTYEIPEVKLPDSPPKRIGFTAVEWGGTIDRK